MRSLSRLSSRSAIPRSGLPSAASSRTGLGTVLGTVIGRVLLSTCLLATPLAACTGDDSDGKGDDADGGDGDGDGDTSVKGQVPLRRLSHYELRNSFRDLFPWVTDLPDTTFVPDAAPWGFDNDGPAMVPSKLLVEQYDRAAREMAERASWDMEQLIPWCDIWGDTEACSQTFVNNIGRKIFRRPLTQQESADFHVMFESGPGAGDPSVGVRLTLQLMLQSPQFIYRLETAPEGGFDGSAGDWVALDDFQIAARLSYFLWASTPDDALLDAAASGSLQTAEGRRTQAERLLDDPRAQDAIYHFHEQWLDLERVNQVSKLEEDALDEDMRASMLEETRRFISAIVEEDGDFTDLLTSPRTFVDDRIAGLYGVTGPGDGSWVEVELNANQRAGVLTQPAFLAGHGHPLNPSPVKRGVFVLQDMLCVPLGSPPPAAAAMMVPEPGPGTTNRELYEDLTADDSCTSCHQLINPLGYTFENYDTMGRWRTQDNGSQVDASGEYQGESFENAVAMLSSFAVHEDVRRCVARKWLHVAYGGDNFISVPEIEDDLVDAFVDDGRIKQLLINVVTHDRFATRPVPEATP